MRTEPKTQMEYWSDGVLDKMDQTQVEPCEIPFQGAHEILRGDVATNKEQLFVTPPRG